jgi:hypothetical protein
MQAVKDLIDGKMALEEIADYLMTRMLTAE